MSRNASHRTAMFRNMARPIRVVRRSHVGLLVALGLLAGCRNALSPTTETNCSTSPDGATVDLGITVNLQLAA